MSVSNTSKSGNTKRIWLTIETSKVDAIIGTAESYGMPVSSFAGLCAWLGYKTIMRVIEPENVYSPDQMVNMWLAAKAQGLDVIEPDSEEFKRMIADAKKT